ncbi:hypothetical protein T440DRAFT_100414 [Plenodomus tracheiphilus IPT5]|uniref:Uncharacterized protein n=1 Tax=Plenodomus tracheiphilus IPT5 TaxID=1408161 RepID=A0A6A7BNS4_9PLEO|nr:hypothetical protein T440DRAFT_100414 [Plenodomus tracheiphilus IPT5]
MAHRTTYAVRDTQALQEQSLRDESLSLCTLLVHLNPYLTMAIAIAMPAGHGVNLNRGSASDAKVTEAASTVHGRNCFAGSFKKRGPCCKARHEQTALKPEKVPLPWTLLQQCMKLHSSPEMIFAHSDVAVPASSNTTRWWWLPAQCSPFL